MSRFSPLPFAVTAALLALCLFVGSDTVSAQLAETTGAMSVQSEMEGGGGGAGDRQYGGKLGELQQNRQAQQAGVDAMAAPGGDSGSSSSSDSASPGSSDSSPPPSSGGAPAASGASQILQTGWWGPGHYFSIIKIILYILVFWCWVYSADWMNGDMEHRKVEERPMQNLYYLLVYLIGSTIAFYIPIFWVAFPLTLLVWFIPLAVYVKMRNAIMQEHERVWTRDHLKFVYATVMRKFGVKVKIQERRTYQDGVPIDLVPDERSGTPQALQGRLIVARNSPGYNDFRAYLYDGIRRNADAVMIEFTPQKTTVRHQIDGMWIEIVQVPRTVEKGKDKDKIELALEAGKLLIGANPADRRSKQLGKFTATNIKTRYDCDFTSQGTANGEVMLVQFTRQRIAFNSLDDLGMNAAMQEKLRGFLNAQKGLFIISAPPANGLRSSTDVFVRNCDRFTRDVAAVEDVQHPHEDIENIVMYRYDSLQNENPMTVLPDIFFKEPQAVIIRDVINVETLTLCCQEIQNNTRLILTTIRAKDAVEAMIRFLMFKVDPQLYASALSGVICQRLLRKLCPDCKEAFQPPPQLLQSMGFPPGSIKELYRIRSPLPEELERKRKPCATCNDIGYKGRTALFELIEVNDGIRSLLVTQPNVNVIRQALLKNRQPGLLQYGIELVRQGVTSVDELSRVMKM